MIETPARITRIDGNTAWVRTEAPSSCGACGGKGCGSSLYARLLHPREPEYPVANPIEAGVGEAVVVGIEDGALLKAIISSYLAPLLLLLTGALIGGIFGELPAVVGAGTGLLLAALWLRQRRSTASPAILRRGQPSCHV